MMEVTTPSSKEAPETEIDLFDLLQVLVENLRLLVFGSLAFGLVTLGITFLISPKFTSTTSFMPPQQQQSATAAMLQSLGAASGLASAAAGLKNPNDQFVVMVKSDSIANRLIDRFDLQQRYDETEYRSNIKKQLAKRTVVTAGKDNLITVEVLDEDPKVAADMANAYVFEFAEMLKRLAITEAQQRRLFFEKQLLQAKDNLTKAEVALRASGVNTTALKSVPDVTVRALAEVQARIAAQEVKIASMRGYLTEASPDLRLALTELAALRGQLAKMEASPTPQALSISDADYVARLRDTKYHEVLFELLARQYELARADEAREGFTVQVVDIALPADRKSSPKRGILAILATLAAGFLLTVFVLVRQALRQAEQDLHSAAKVHRLKGAWRRSLGLRMVGKG